MEPEHKKQINALLRRQLLAKFYQLQAAAGRSAQESVYDTTATVGNYIPLLALIGQTTVEDLLRGNATNPSIEWEYEGRTLALSAVMLKSLYQEPEYTGIRRGRADILYCLLTFITGSETTASQLIKRLINEHQSVNDIGGKRLDLIQKNQFSKRLRQLKNQLETAQEDSSLLYIWRYIQQKVLALDAEKTAAYLCYFTASDSQYERQCIGQFEKIRSNENEELSIFPYTILHTLQCYIKHCAEPLDIDMSDWAIQLQEWKKEYHTVIATDQEVLVNDILAQDTIIAKEREVLNNEYILHHPFQKGGNNFIGAKIKYKDRSYTITRFLHDSKDSVIWEATRQNGQQLEYVVVKMLRPQATSKVKLQFKKGAQQQQRLASAVKTEFVQIVPVLEDICEDPDTGLVWFIMKKIGDPNQSASTGQVLNSTEWLNTLDKSNKQTYLQQVRQAFSALANFFQLLHQQGVAHLNICDSSLLRDEKGQWWIIDFTNHQQQDHHHGYGDYLSAAKRDYAAYDLLSQPKLAFDTAKKADHYAFSRLFTYAMLLGINKADNWQGRQHNNLDLTNRFENLNESTLSFINTSLTLNTNNNNDFSRFSHDLETISYQNAIQPFNQTAFLRQLGYFFITVLFVSVFTWGLLSRQEQQQSEQIKQTLTGKIKQQEAWFLASADADNKMYLDSAGVKDNFEHTRFLSRIDTIIRSFSTVHQKVTIHDDTSMWHGSYYSHGRKNIPVDSINLLFGGIDSLFSLWASLYSLGNKENIHKTLAAMLHFDTENMIYPILIYFHHPATDLMYRFPTSNADFSHYEPDKRDWYPQVYDTSNLKVIPLDGGPHAGRPYLTTVYSDYKAGVQPVRTLFFKHKESGITLLIDFVFKIDLSQFDDL